MQIRQTEPNVVHAGIMPGLLTLCNDRMPDRSSASMSSDWLRARRWTTVCMEPRRHLLKYDDMLPARTFSTEPNTVCTMSDAIKSKTKGNLARTGTHGQLQTAAATNTTQMHNTGNNTQPVSAAYLATWVSVFVCVFLRGCAGARRTDRPNTEHSD